jgi:hypothetical protein
MPTYQVDIDDDGPRSLHAKLKKDGQRCHRASKLDVNAVDVEGPDDDVAQLVTYLVWIREH